jgi:hypothetical protein
VSAKGISCVNDGKNHHVDGRDVTVDAYLIGAFKLRFLSSGARRFSEVITEVEPTHSNKSARKYSIQLILKRFLQMLIDLTECEIGCQVRIGYEIDSPHYHPINMMLPAPRFKAWCYIF